MYRTKTKTTFKKCETKLKRKKCKNTSILPYNMLYLSMKLQQSKQSNNKKSLYQNFRLVNPNVTRREVKIMDNRRVYERKLSWSSSLKRQSEDFQKQYKTE